MFRIDAFNLPARTNDLVVKTYDNDQNIVSKQVYTVYYSGGSDTNVAVANAAVTPVGTVNSSATIYDVDATKFGFTFPSSTGKFSTTGSEVTIR